MGKIADFSHHNTIDWSRAKDELDLAIIRVQYGSSLIDTKYKSFVAGCKQYGIPFGHYAYCRFVSVNDAIVEADDFHERADKDALFLVADVEEQTCRNEADLVPATQAFIDRLKAKGWKVGLYTGHFFYNKYGMNKVKADFLWIPRYPATDKGLPTGPKPDMACDIWQYSEKGTMAGVSGAVDLNQLMGSKTLEWYIGEEEEAAVPTSNDSHFTTNPITAKFRILATDLRYRMGPGTEYAVGGKVETGKVYNCTAYLSDWHELIISDGKKGWVKGHSSDGKAFISKI